MKEFYLINVQQLGNYFQSLFRVPDPDISKCRTLTSVNIRKRWRRLQNTVLNLQFPYVCWSHSNNCEPGWAEAQSGTSKNSNQTEERGLWSRFITRDQYQFSHQALLALLVPGCGRPSCCPSAWEKAMENKWARCTMGAGTKIRLTGQTPTYQPSPTLRGSLRVYN